MNKKEKTHLNYKLAWGFGAVAGATVIGNPLFQVIFTGVLTFLFCLFIFGLIDKYFK